VDLLCECALAAALELSARGMDIQIGYAGGEGTGGIVGGKEEGSPLNAAELASALAWPAAIFRPGPAKTGGRRKPAEAAQRAVLPKAPGDRAVLILALPGTYPESSALDVFLKNRDPKQSVDMVFIYNAESRRAAELEENAGICVNHYNRRSGIHAEKTAVSPAREGKNG